MGNNTQQSRLLKQTINKTSGQQANKNDEIFVKQVGKQVKTQVAIIVAFVILAVIIGGSVFAYEYLKGKGITEETGASSNDSKENEKTDDLKEGWNSYKSSTYIGMTVQYPLGWEVIEESRYGIRGFSFKFTNGSITWRFEPEYGGILSPTPTVNDVPKDWCIGGLVNYKNGYDSDLYQDVDKNLRCSDSHQVIIVEPVTWDDELTEEDYSILGEITVSLSRD